MGGLIPAYNLYREEIWFHGILTFLKSVAERKGEKNIWVKHETAITTHFTLIIAYFCVKQHIEWLKNVQDWCDCGKWVLQE